MDAVNQLIKNTLKILEERSLTRADLARLAKTNISKAYIYLMLDAAYDSSVKKWEMLAGALGLSLAQLMTYHKYNGPAPEGTEELAENYALSDNAGRTALLAASRALVAGRSDRNTES